MTDILKSIFKIYLYSEIARYKSSLIKIVLKLQLSEKDKFFGNK